MSLQRGPEPGEMGLICHKDKSFHLLPGSFLPRKLGFFFFFFLPAERAPEASVALEHAFQKKREIPGCFFFKHELFPPFKIQLMIERNNVETKETSLYK